MKSAIPPRRRRLAPNRLIALVAALLVVASWFALEGTGTDPKFREYPSGTSAGITQPKTTPETPYAFDDATLCLTESGSVSVEKVEIRKPSGGLEVRAFAVRPPQSLTNYSYLNDPRQQLAEVGFETHGPQIVDVVCPAETDSRTWGPGIGVRLLAVEIVKPADVDAWGEGLLVTYRTTRGRHTFVIPFALALCAGDIGDGRQACGR